MRDIPDLNDLYNAQDIILLCEIFENRFQAMYEKSSFNPRKCNSASKLSGCIQREQSKVILALPTNNSIMETLTGGFNCVNTQLSFNNKLLMANLTDTDYKKMNIDESFKAYKRNDLKAIYKIKFDNENTYHERRIITKILKLDENIHYGYAMTKPMPTGCIKEYPSPSWLKFNLLLETVNLDDEIGHLFVVDIEFDVKRATEYEYMYNEIFPTIIEKQKLLKANKRSVYQLLELMQKTSDGVPKTYRCTEKSHATMFPKRFISLYLEDLSFLIKRCCWRVTKIYTPYTFKQSRFKRDFVLMNQKSR